MSPSLKNGKVLVQDSEGVFLVPTNPASARKLINSGQAKIASFEPFTIQLAKQVPSPNTERRVEKMKITNLYEYFSKPQPVYIQNISNPIGVISLEFRRPNGEVFSHRVPANRNPEILTNIVPFDAIRDSVQFLSFLQKTPNGTGPHLQLLSEEEFNEFYKKKQEELGADSVEELIDDAQNKARTFNDPSHKIVSEEETKAPLNERTTLEPEVNPRVIAICQQLDPENSNRVDAREAIDTFASLELTTIDYDYILSHCYDQLNKSNGVIRKWSTARMRENLDKINDEIIRPQAEAKRTRVAK